MKKIGVLIFVFLLGLTRSFAQVEIPEFEKHFFKKFNVTQLFRSSCEFNYACVIASTDKNSKIVNVQIMNILPKDMYAQFDVLKGFQFPPKYSVSNKPVLFFLTFDNSDFCGEINVKLDTTNRVIREMLSITGVQLTKDPETIVLYRPFFKKCLRK